MSEPVRIEAAGELDVVTSSDLRRDLYAAIDGNAGETVIVDLTAVEFVDSTALGVLVGALKHARANGGDVKLTIPRAQVWKVFTITGLDRVFETVEGGTA